MLKIDTSTSPNSDVVLKAKLDFVGLFMDIETVETTSNHHFQNTELSHKKIGVIYHTEDTSQMVAGDGGEEEVVEASVWRAEQLGNG